MDRAEWHQIFLVRVPEPGVYQLRCEGDVEHFGLGRDLPSGWFDRFTALLALVLAAGVAAATTVVVVRRRTTPRPRRDPW